jgi:hypothetical protein
MKINYTKHAIFDEKFAEQDKINLHKPQIFNYQFQKSK